MKDSSRGNYRFGNTVSITPDPDWSIDSDAEPFVTTHWYATESQRDAASDHYRRHGATVTDLVR